jgi:hypothetical protein
VLPWMPDAVRDYLLADPVFAGVLTASRVAFKAPADVTTPFGVIQVPGNNSIDGGGVAWSPLVQFDGYCPTSDPAADRIAWDIAAAAGVLAARNVTYQNVTWSGRLIDGPMKAAPDTSRGESAALARALIRVELTVHAR